VLMDFHCVEVLLGLPACRVIHQVLGSQQRDVHLERRDEHIVCPHCGTCCSRVKASRPRCLRDLPILEHPVMLWLPLRRFACPESVPLATGTSSAAPSVWPRRFLTVCALGTNPRDAPLGPAGAPRVRVTRWVIEEPCGALALTSAATTGYGQRLQRRLAPLPCGWGRRGQAVAQRNTLAVDHHHPLRAFAPLGLAAAGPLCSRGPSCRPHRLRPRPVGLGRPLGPARPS
jgi:zinc-finger of transposase IS204/IS1001/IS1096/IS1165